MPCSVDAVLTVPVNKAPAIAELRLNPGTIVVNPLILVCGVNVESLLRIPTTVLLIKNLTTTWLADPLSRIVSTTAPLVPDVVV